MTSVEFCKKCGSIMLPEKKKKTVALKCRKCSYSTKKGIREIKLLEKRKPAKTVVVLEKNHSPLPIIDMLCPSCSNGKAYYWMQQTRSADEPPTQFFRCTNVKCKHTWREYK